MDKITLRTENSNQIRKSLSRIANMVINDELDTKKANCITYILNSCLNAVRTDDIEQKLKELEQLLQDRKLI